MPDLPDPEGHEFFEPEPESTPYIVGEQGPETITIGDSDVVLRILGEDEE